MLRDDLQSCYGALNVLHSCLELAMYGWPTCWNALKFLATSLLNVKG